MAPFQETAWTAEISQVPDEPEISLSGQAAMISGGNETAVSIELFEAPLDHTFGWYVQDGTCAEPGLPIVTQLSVYPLLPIDLEGRSEGFALVPRGVNRNQDLSIVVLADPLLASRVVGCGDMIEFAG